MSTWYNVLMKELSKLYLLLLILVLSAFALMAFLLYDSGLRMDTLKNMAEGRDFDAIEREDQRRGQSVKKLRACTDDAAEAAADAVDDRYPPQTDEGARRGISILMYHNVYDPYNPPQTRIDDNYISTENLEAELQYLTEEGYSFPTWEEVRKYVDGEIDLPEKSVVLTFDDGTDGFKKNGVPLLKKYNVHATAFIIVSKNGDKWVADKDDYPDLDLESHSYDMHRPGGRIGHGGVMTALTEDQIIEDLKMSEQVIGNHNAFAYPFGDFDDFGYCRDAVEKAGYLVGVTTKYGKVYPGADPYLLPRMRVNGRNSLEAFKTLL